MGCLWRWLFVSRGVFLRELRDGHKTYSQRCHPLFPLLLFVLLTIGKALGAKKRINNILHNWKFYWCFLTLWFSYDVFRSRLADSLNVSFYAGSVTWHPPLTRTQSLLLDGTRVVQPWYTATGYELDWPSSIGGLVAKQENALQQGIPLAPFLCNCFHRTTRTRYRYNLVE